ncbi:MAG: hypothetical protein LBV20_07305 [Treponema sp.]|jgi:predicted PurR-regulated permease PerM|nr:hypothetical protein [Treponema sp.]
MFPPELVDLIKQLVTSKEIIGVTVFLVLFFSLVFYVARTHHPRKRRSSLVLPLKKQKNAKAESISDDMIDDELGLED